MRVASHRPVFVFVLLATALCTETQAQGTAPPAPQSTSSSVIVWRLRNPFRFFKRPEHFAAYVEAMRKAGTDKGPNPILATEQALAAKTDGEGWAAGIFEHIADEACWYKPATSNGTQPAQPEPAPSAPKKAGNGNGASREPCGDYIKPKTHGVLLSAPSVMTACTWRVGTTDINAADCTKAVEAQIPYPEGVAVSLHSAGSEIARETIQVTDLLVVGMGDSFGAGDGNPDRPVSFRVNRPMGYDAERDGYPQRYDLTSDVSYTDVRFRNKGAGWSHRSCHRSLYSHQLRVALHLAAEDAAGHRSVTYLGLACSGSTMLSMFGPYNGYEDPVSSADLPHSRRVYELSQIDILAHALCAPGTPRVDESVNYNEGEYLEIGERKIHVFTCPEESRLRKPDLLLLSIGGNDVGFSGLVSNAALLNRYLGYVKLFDEDPRITPEKAQVFMGRIPGRYAALASALQAVAGTPPKRIILSAYPDMNDDQDGKPCTTTTRGFDVGVAWRLQAKAVAAAQTFMDKTLTPAMATAAEMAGWTFADPHRTASLFKRHGICALTAEELADPALADAQFPRFHEVDGLGTWTPFKPADYRHYAARQRFFRTPNDAFLGTHFHTRHIPIMDGGPEVQIAVWSAYSGAFHPTAEGQAAIGDAVLSAAQSVLTN